MAGWESDNFNIDSNTGFIDNNNCSNNNNVGVVELIDNGGRSHQYVYGMEDCSCGDDSLVIRLDSDGRSKIANVTDSLRLKSVDDCDVVAMRRDRNAAPFEQNFEFYSSGTHYVNYKTFDAEMDASAFTNCDDITNVYIGKKFGTIKDHAFQNCGGLVTVCAPGVTLVENNAFVNSSISKFLFKSGSGSIRVEPAAFANCSNLMVFENADECDCEMNTNENIIRFGAISYFGTRAFYNCSGLTGSAVINGYMSPYAIQGTGFSALSIYSNSVDITSFENCSSLSSVTFANYGIPTNVTNTSGDGVFFSGCYNLSTVRINSYTKMNLPGDSRAFNTMHRGVIVYVQADLLEDYRGDVHWHCNNPDIFFQPIP